MATENLAPQVISRLLKEIRDLVKHPSEGIVYQESEENTVSEIFAFIKGPDGTPYAGGKFRVKLVLSEDYPSSPPRGFFLTKIYHPNGKQTTVPNLLNHLTFILFYCCSFKQW
jgi:ubiquitin-conjugating enzyme E2 S